MVNRYSPQWNVRVVGGDGFALSADRATQSLNMIDYNHHEIHEGSSYIASNAIDIAATTFTRYQITTPNTTKWAHMKIIVDAEAEFNVSLVEGSTPSSGTTWTAYNRDRNSSNTSGLTLKTAIATTGGTTIWDKRLASTFSTGLQSRGESEFILKQNEDYTLIINNPTAATNYVSVELDWYEHTNDVTV